MKCQGVKLDDIILVADVLELQGRRCVTPQLGERKQKLSSMEHARQLLAQVLWEEALCKGPVVGQGDLQDEPPPFCDQPGLRLSSPRPCPTAYPLSRPGSAHCARMEQWERCLDNRHRHLEDRMTSVNTARAHRSRHLQHTSDVWHERLQQGENLTAYFQQEQGQAMAQYGRELATSRRQHDREQAARFTAESESYVRSMNANSGDRAEKASSFRAAGHQDREMHLAELCLESYGRRTTATERRGVQLEAKTVQQVQQATSRQLQHWQKQRIDELRLGERTGLKQVLDSPPVFSHRQRFD